MKPIAAGLVAAASYRKRRDWRTGAELQLPEGLLSDEKLICASPGCRR